MRKGWIGGAGVFAALAAGLVACSATPAATAPSPTPGVVPPSPSATSSPTPAVASTSPTAAPTTSTFAVSVEPATPVAGQPVSIVVTGLQPGESVDLTIGPAQTPGGTPRKITADPSGVARSSNTINTPRSLDFVARVQRSDGTTAQVAFTIAGSEAALPSPTSYTVAVTPTFNPQMSCSPASGPSGTDFRCLLSGFLPGARVNDCFTGPGYTTPLCNSLPGGVPASGMWVSHTDVPLAAGQYTRTVTVDGAGQFVGKFTVTR